MNILMIPTKRGRYGHPKITVTSYIRADVFDIHGNCTGIGIHEINKSEQEGINNVLERIFIELKNRKR